MRTLEGLIELKAPPHCCGNKVQLGASYCQLLFFFSSPRAKSVFMHHLVSWSSPLAGIKESTEKSGATSSWKLGSPASLVILSFIDPTCLGDLLASISATNCLSQKQTLFSPNGKRPDDSSFVCSSCVMSGCKERGDKNPVYGKH